MFFDFELVSISEGGESIECGFCSRQTRFEKTIDMIPIGKTNVIVVQLNVMKKIHEFNQSLNWINLKFRCSLISRQLNQLTAESRTNPDRVGLEKLIEEQNKEYYELYDQLDRVMTVYDGRSILRTNSQVIPAQLSRAEVRTYFKAFIGFILFSSLKKIVYYTAFESFDWFDNVRRSTAMQRMWNPKFCICQYNVFVHTSHSLVKV